MLEINQAYLYIYVVVCRVVDLFLQWHGLLFIKEFYNLEEESQMANWDIGVITEWPDAYLIPGTQHLTTQMFDLIRHNKNSSIEHHDDQGQQMLSSLFE